MRYYFLTLGAIVVVCMGCAGVDGQSVLKTNQHVAPQAAMLQHPGPMVDGPGPGVMGILAQPGGGMGMGGPMMGAPQMSTQVKFIGQVLPTARLLNFHLNLNRIFSRKLYLGIADGWVECDGQKVFEAKDIRVGLFANPATAMA